MNAPLNPLNVYDREKLRRLFLIQRTVGEFMLARGCDLTQVRVGIEIAPKVVDFSPNIRIVDLTPFQSLDFSFEDFLAFREQLGIFRTRNSFTSLYENAEGQRFFIMFFDAEPGKAVSKQELTKFENLVSVGVQANGQSWLCGVKIFLVTENGMGADPNSFLEKCISGYDITLFLDKELAFNVTKHSLAPIHTLHVPRNSRGPNQPDTVKLWATTEGIPAEKLPLVEDGDPVARWWGAKVGDILVNEIMAPERDTSIQYQHVRKTPRK